jgi:hypothetical protein
MEGIPKTDADPSEGKEKKGDEGVWKKKEGGSESLSKGNLPTPI